MDLNGWATMISVDQIIKRLYLVASHLLDLALGLRWRLINTCNASVLVALLVYVKKYSWRNKCNASVFVAVSLFVHVKKYSSRRIDKYNQNQIKQSDLSWLTLLLTIGWILINK